LKYKRKATEDKSPEQDAATPTGKEGVKNGNENDQEGPIMPRTRNRGHDKAGPLHKKQKTSKDTKPVFVNTFKAYSRQRDAADWEENGAENKEDVDERTDTKSTLEDNERFQESGYPAHQEEDGSHVAGSNSSSPRQLYDIDSDYVDK
jgi:hypothetical protein